MGTSLAKPDLLPPGKIEHAASGSTIAIEQTAKGMVHTLSERGLTATYKIRYQLGGGLMGRTYLVRNGDYLLESPASWFNVYGWDVSPGYNKMAIIDFDRVMDQQCLSCHTDSVRFADADRRRLKTNDLSAISCDRCHGPADDHVRHPAANNIINPAKLTGRPRDSVCEQCHLEGITRILNPGKAWSDFQVGRPTETVFATYVAHGGNAQDVIAVSQTEQLAQSQCVRATEGKLWCGTCHTVHGEVTDRKEQIRAVCTNCHVSLSAAAHPAPVSDCIGCHMPRSATTDISHAALTDHRILRRPIAATPDGQPLQVRAWSPPPAASAERDWALAQIVAGFSKQSPALAEDGFRMLQSLPGEQRDRDPEVLSDLEGLAVQQGRLDDAAVLGLKIIALQPQSAKAALNLGIVYKRAGKSAEAEQQLNRAIEIDPGLKQAYMELAKLYADEQRIQDATAVIDRYLKWAPQDIMFRLQRERMN